jgi:thermosome
MVKSSLGPRGLDKMLIGGHGEITVTNDGATILRRAEIFHPVGKLMLEMAWAADKEVGDGTKSVVVLAGALLEKAEELSAEGLHPTVICDGYALALQEALEALNRIALNVPPTDKGWFRKVVRTSLMSKALSGESESLADAAVDAVLCVADKARDRYHVDIDNIFVKTKAGRMVGETSLVKGVVLDKRVVHPGMPKRIENAKIALILNEIKVERTHYDTRIMIDDASMMRRFLDEEVQIYKESVDKLASAGGNVVLCQKKSNEKARDLLAKKGILVVEDVDEKQMALLARATGAQILPNLDELREADLGSAGLVEERIIGEDRYLFVEQCENPKAVTLFVRGGQQQVVEEVERALRDAVMVAKDVLEKPAVVAGGGAAESHISYELRKSAAKVSGREQLAVQKFADAVETIPLTLAENAGLDPLDIQVELRAKHGEGKIWFGVDVLNGCVADSYAKDVLEPLLVKEHILRSATGVACTILKIDDIVAGHKAAQTTSIKSSK